MKAKYYGLVAFAFMMLCAVGVATDALKRAPGSGRDTLRPTRASLLGPGMRVPDPGTIRQIGRLTRLLPVLARPLGPDTTPVNLGLFGYAPDRKKGDTASGLNRRVFAYTVSFAFSGGDKAFCVIDNAFYPQGALLPDGARVTAVRADGVRIQKDGFERWLPVNKNTAAKQSKGKDDKK